MHAGRRLEQTPTGIKIGSGYQPARPEVRGSDGQFRSYRSWPDPDSAKLQRALLEPAAKRFDFEEAMACVVFLAFLVILVVALPWVVEIAR